MAPKARASNTDAQWQVHLGCGHRNCKKQAHKAAKDWFVKQQGGVAEHSAYWTCTSCHRWTWYPPKPAPADVAEPPPPPQKPDNRALPTLGDWMQSLTGGAGDVPISVEDSDAEDEVVNDTLADEVTGLEQKVAFLRGAPSAFPEAPRLLQEAA